MASAARTALPWMGSAAWTGSLNALLIWIDQQRLECLLWVYLPDGARSSAGGHRLLSWQQPCRQRPAGQRRRAVETAAPAEQPGLPQGCSGLVHRREVHVDQLSCKDGIEVGMCRRQCFTRIAANNGRHRGDSVCRRSSQAGCCRPAHVFQAARDATTCTHCVAAR